MVQVANPTAALTDRWLPTLTVQRTTATGTDNNFVINAPYVWLLCAPAGGALTLTGLAFAPGNVDGSRVVIENTGSWPVLLPDQDAGSTAVNRFFSQATIAPGYRAVAMYDGTAARWRLSTDPIAIYPCTLTPVVNSSALTTVLSFSVPAGTWRDGHLIQIPWSYSLVNTTGSTRTYNLYMAAGSGSDAIIASAVSVPNGTSVNLMRLTTLVRANADVRELEGQDDSVPDFTSPVTVVLKVQLSFASASFSLTPIAAQAIHYKGET